MMAVAAAAEVSSAGCSSTDTSSAGDEERMRRLFQTCDGDGDGFISRNDLLMVCRQLNMEASVAEIMYQLGADENGKISFQDFSQCHMELVQEIKKEEVELSVKSNDSCKKKKLRDRVVSWPTSSNNSLGALSGARESWEYDSGARDLWSPDLHSNFTLQKVLEYGGSNVTQQAALQRLLAQVSNFSNSVGGRCLELANTGCQCKMDVSRWEGVGADCSTCQICTSHLKRSCFLERLHQEQTTNYYKNVLNASSCNCSGVCSFLSPPV